jgi:hypothetical protein
MEVLLREGVDVNINGYERESLRRHSFHISNVPLICAAYYFDRETTRQVKAMQLLLENGADINTQDKEGNLAAKVIGDWLLHRLFIVSEYEIEKDGAKKAEFESLKVIAKLLQEKRAYLPDDLRKRIYETAHRNQMTMMLGGLVDT